MRDFERDSVAFINFLMRNFNEFSTNMLQYSHPKLINDLWAQSESIVDSLDPSNTYLNVGTGVGFLEAIAASKSYNVKTLELDINYIQDQTVRKSYEWWNHRVGTSIDYRMTTYRKEAGSFSTTIEPDAFFDEVLFYRFGPFQSPTSEHLKPFISYMSNHTRKFRLYRATLHNDILNYFGDHYTVDEATDYVVVNLH